MGNIGLQVVQNCPELPRSKLPVPDYGRFTVQCTSRNFPRGAEGNGKSTVKIYSLRAEMCIA